MEIIWLYLIIAILFVPRFGHRLLRLAVLSGIIRQKYLRVSAVVGHLDELHAGPHGGVSSVHEHHDLMTFANKVCDLKTIRIVCGHKDKLILLKMTDCQL